MCFKEGNVIVKTVLRGCFSDCFKGSLKASLHGFSKEARKENGPIWVYLQGSLFGSLFQKSSYAKWSQKGSLRRRRAHMGQSKVGSSMLAARRRPCSALAMPLFLLASIGYGHPQGPYWSLSGIPGFPIGAC